MLQYYYFLNMHMHQRIYQLLPNIDKESKKNQLIFNIDIRAV